MPLPLLPSIAVGGSLLTKWLSIAFIVGLISKIFIALGLGYFAFTGIDMGIDAIHLKLNSSLSGMPFDAKQLIDMAGITTILTWLINAYAFRVLVRGAKVALMQSKSIAHFS